MLSQIPLYFIAINNPDLTHLQCWTRTKKSCLLSGCHVGRIDETKDVWTRACPRGAVTTDDPTQPRAEPQWGYPRANPPGGASSRRTMVRPHEWPGLYAETCYVQKFLMRGPIVMKLCTGIEVSFMDHLIVHKWRGPVTSRICDVAKEFRTFIDITG